MIGFKRVRKRDGGKKDEKEVVLEGIDIGVILREEGWLRL